MAQKKVRVADLVVEFGNANGVTFGTNGQTITASYNSTQFLTTQTVQTQGFPRAVYDGANSISSGTIRFTNANGVSFSFNGQTVSGSVNTSYRASNDAIGLNT